MARNLLLITVMALLIHENMPSANPQLGAPYYQPGFSSYYQPIPAPYHQQAAAPFYQPSLAPYYPVDYGFGPLAGYEEEYNPFFYAGTGNCPVASLISPCTCQTNQLPAGTPFGAITCPAGQTAANIQTILGKVPAGLNIQLVILNLRRGTNVANSVPASFTANYPKASIRIVHPLLATECIDSSLLAPCTCVLGVTTCPAGATIAQIQAAYNKIAPNTNLGVVILNFPAGATTAVPANLLGTNGANKIELIGPSGNTKSQLTIAAGAFTSSGPTDTQFWIVNFDVVNVDYSFLANFNVLTTLRINRCANPPTAAKQPKNLPANLPQLTTISVDGVNIKQAGR